jgi:hypothetical protein
MAVGIPHYTRFELDQLLPNWECWLPPSQVSFLEIYFEYDGDLEAIHLHTGIVMPRLHKTLHNIQKKIDTCLLVKMFWCQRRNYNCIWPGCEKEAHCRNLCHAHYFICRGHFRGYTLAKNRRQERERHRRLKTKVITADADRCNVWPN